MGWRELWGSGLGRARSSRPSWVPALEQSSGTQKRASNIDFCKTSLAIVKVLGGLGDNFGTFLGPKWHHVGVIFGLFGTLGRLQVRFF